MAHDVFISHSAKDKTTADAMCAMLESEGIRCWIAPRDVTPGMEWGKCIIDAIRNARIMVLVFTANANSSSQIRREVERAINHDVAVLPFRIENVVPDESLEYFIGNVHWLDALTPPLEAHLKNLVGTIKILLAQARPLQEQPAPGPLRPVAAAAYEAPQPVPPSYKASRPEPFVTEPVARAEAAPVPPRTAEVKSSAEAAGVAQFGRIGPVAETSTHDGAGTRKSGEWYSGGGTAAPAGLSKVPIWVWGGGAFSVLLLMVIFFAVRSASHPSPAVSSSPASEASPEASSAAPSDSAPSAAAGGATSSVPSVTPAPKSKQSIQESYQQAEDLIAQKRYAEARAPAQQACDGGNLGGCVDLGYLYGDGLGVALDYVRARSLYQKACDGGNLTGCSNLGWLYQNGLGVATDYNKARVAYQKSCDGGYMGGCDNLGTLYQNGWSVTQDYAQARALFQKACDGGNLYGCNDLGWIYQSGLGVTKDYTQARSLFQKVCDGGNTKGCGALGYLYANGIGVTQDTAKGTTLLQEGCTGGDQWSCNRLKQVQK
jgi:uncharacterized protein